MACTLDLSDDEVECLMRVLVTYIDATTCILRARDAPHFSADAMLVMYGDIRLAAQVAGRLPYRYRPRPLEEIIE